MEDKRILELTNVHLESDRGDDIFTDLNLIVNAGQSAMISGPAGSGKTCLVEMLLGMRPPSSGSVELFGEVLKPRKRSQHRRLRRKIGGVGGIYGLAPAFTVAENIAFPLVIGGERKKSLREKTLRIMGEFSLLKQAGEYPDRLTRVEYTLVQFARASIADQPLLIIGGPSEALDSKTYEDIFEYLIKVAASGRSMLILSSELPLGQLPNMDFYQIEQGKLV